MLPNVTRDCRGDKSDVSRVIQDHRTRAASSNDLGARLRANPTEEVL